MSLKSTELYLAPGCSRLWLIFLRPGKPISATALALLSALTFSMTFAMSGPALAQQQEGKSQNQSENQPENQSQNQSTLEDLSQGSEPNQSQQDSSVVDTIFDTVKNPRILLPDDPFVTVTHKWDKAVRGFRKGHSFTLLGNFRRVDYELSDNSYPEITTELLAGQLRYAYHIQSNRALGYFLGTSLGYVEPQVRGPEQLEYQRFLEFPSLLAGGVFNASSYFRAYAYFEGYLIRIEKFRRIPLNNAIDTTGETARLGLGFDLFYLLQWGVTFDVSYSWSKMRIPKPESSAAHGVEEVIMSGNSYAIGLVLHLI